MKPELKPKTCKHCGDEFMPARLMQTVCGPKCASKFVRKAKIQERQQTRMRKESIKTIPTLLREAQTAFNAWVRARDAKQPCISCGKPPGDMTGLHAGRDAGHYRSTGSASHLRFHEDNCHAQCVECNQWKAGNAVDYRIRLVHRIGQTRVEALERDNQVIKWTAQGLREIRTTYKAKRKQLEKETA
jgi:hypothetical protein